MPRKNDQSAKPSLGVFGPVEQLIVEIVRASPSATVGNVHEILSAERPMAYTTVMTIMSRLAEKGVLRRQKEGRSFVYEIAAQSESLVGARLRKLFDGLFVGLRAPAIKSFVESVSKLDDQALAELESEVKKAKERRKRSRV